MPISSAQPAREARSAFSLLDFFMTPWVDKSIAIIACVPFLVTLYLRIRAFGFDFPRVVVVIHISILIATMFSRRAPTRITPNPFFLAAGICCDLLASSRRDFRASWAPAPA